jgi:hypothetical protein
MENIIINGTKSNQCIKIVTSFGSSNRSSEARYKTSYYPHSIQILSLFRYKKS